MLETDSRASANCTTSRRMYDSGLLLHSDGIFEWESARSNLQRERPIEPRKERAAIKRYRGRDDVPSFFHSCDNTQRPINTKHHVSSLEPRRKAFYRGFWHRII